MPRAPLEGKVCLVTGATGGIGKALALGLARRGATTIVLGRDAARARAAQDEITRRSGNPRVEAHAADFRRFDDVRRLAQEVTVEHRALHVLINNAGVYLRRFEPAQHGMETQFVVNYLSHFLLTLCLLPALRRGAPSRVISVTSTAHRWVDSPLAEFGDPRDYNGAAAYARSKLAQVLFTRELARRLQGTGIDVNCYHPGPVATGLGRGQLPWFVEMWRAFMLRPSAGARTGLRLATARRLEGRTGGYYWRRFPLRASRAARDPDLRRELWALSERWTGQKWSEENPYKAAAKSAAGPR